MSDPSPFVPPPAVGRSFTGERRVRWGDVDRHGRLRLDALARYLQDVANDDTRDLGHDHMGPWVVRRTAVAVEVAPTAGEVVALTTFSGGLGPRWAERRTSLRGDDGSRVETSSVWISIDPGTGRPARLSEQFLAAYGESSGDRKVDARRHHQRPPDGARQRPWPLRSTDHDPLGHVNNAATWEPVEDELDRVAMVPAWAEVEYGDAIEPTDEVALVSDEDGTGTVRIWLTVAGTVRASAVVHTRASAPERHERRSRWS